MGISAVSRLTEPIMFFYESTPVYRESSYCFVSHVTSSNFKIHYHLSHHPVFAEKELHGKIDRLLLLLECPQNEDEYAGLVGTMCTREAAEFIAISKRTFERRVKEGAIRPIAKNMKKNQFLKRDVVQLYIAYRGYKPPHLP